MILTDQDPNYYNWWVMRRLSVRWFFILLVFMFTVVTVFNVQGNTSEANVRKEQPKKAKKVKTKNKKVREPREVRKAKKTQAKKEAKIKKDYDKYVSDSRKRAYEIQTPEVKERMKQDKKDIKSREKDRKKKADSSTKKAQKKYKK
jgi:hypothetical protein